MKAVKCRYCNSEHLNHLAWKDVLPQIEDVDRRLMYEGAKPIPRTLTFCESCNAWLPTHVERKMVDELIAALRLIHSVPELSSGRLEHGDRPDIRLHLDGDVYGLEVTRIVRGGDDAVRRAQWLRSVERGGRLLRRQRGDPPAWVSLRWNPAPPPADAEHVSRLLVDVVELHLPTTVGDMAYLDPHDLSDEVIRFVHAMDIRRSRVDDMWVSGFSNNPDVQSSELQTVIDEKARVVGGYSRAIGGLWLLIYGEPSNAAQALDITDEALATEYVGPFDRVFFVDCMDKTAELRIRTNIPRVPANA